MLKIGSNEIMVFLLGIGGVVFLLSQILRIPISELGLNLVFILLFVFIMVIHAWKTLGFSEMFVFFLIAGELITAAALAFKRPGDGLPPEYSEDLIGRHTRRALAKDEQIRLEDCE